MSYVAEKRLRNPFYYAGSKWRNAREIIKLFPEHKTYVEVFGGTLAILLNKKRSWREIANDINDEIFTFYKVLLTDYERFIEKVRWFVASEKLLYFFKNYKPENELMKAVRFFFLHTIAFSGNERATFAVRHVNRAIQKLPSLEKIRKRLEHVQILNRDFREIITRYDSKDTLFYLDPPYYKIGDELYAHYFSYQDHEDLANLLRSIQGKFVLSYNNSEIIRELYSWANIKLLKFHYSMIRGYNKEQYELLITNF